jgi:hypothetical protein
MNLRGVNLSMQRNMERLIFPFSPVSVTLKKNVIVITTSKQDQRGTIGG